MLAATAAAAIGCRSEAREKSVKAVRAADAGPAQAWRCGAIHDERPLSRKLAEPGRRFVLGVIADSKEPLPATLDNLTRFARVFAREKVAAVLALGGLGANEDEIARVLGALAGAGAPVLALPGDREPEAAFHAAVERARHHGLDVIDLAQVRTVDGGGFAVVSLPGYPWPHYLGAGSFGCRYADADVQALRGLFDALSGSTLRVLASHTPPRGHGPDDVDWALGGANVGDPALTRFLTQAGVSLALFAHVDEAGGRAVGMPADADGGAATAGPLGENLWAERLWLNAGAADSVPHALGAGGTARGQAALVEFSDGRLRYRVVRP
jgi:Icc-related predicted phosphoesterase